jgi:hypothetical protein
VQGTTTTQAKAPQPDPAGRLDKQITDLGGLVSLALALVTVFTATRARVAAERQSAEGLKRGPVRGELALDVGLLVLTIGVIIATAPIAFDALGRQEVGHNAGALRLVIVVVWLLLCALAVWQITIALATRKTLKGIDADPQPSSGKR